MIKLRTGGNFGFKIINVPVRLLGSVEYLRFGPKFDVANRTLYLKKFRLVQCAPQTFFPRGVIVLPKLNTLQLRILTKITFFVN